MPLDPGAVGRQAAPSTYGWTTRDTELYALAVGAGPRPGDLPFCTEGTRALGEHRVLPTFGAVACYDMALLDAVGDYDRSALVHAGMRVRVRRALPSSGTLRVESSVAAVTDGGPGRHAAVTIGLTGTDPASGEVLVENESTVLVRGAGGFGGETAPSGARTELPEREPDLCLRSGTREDAALLYRLTGDRNPLHHDPQLAVAAGFARPLLHGLCTFGIVGRDLLAAYCDDAVERFDELSVRFSAPVYPGDDLLTAVWRVDRGEVRFCTEALPTAATDGTAERRVVLTDGRFRFTPATD